MRQTRVTSGVQQTTSHLATDATVPHYGLLHQPPQRCPNRSELLPQVRRQMNAVLVSRLRRQVISHQRRLATAHEADLDAEAVRVVDPFSRCGSSSDSPVPTG